MSENKESVKRNIIKVGVIMRYGINNAVLIHNALKSENTQEKLNSIYDILELCTMKAEDKLFVIQKLLSYPKAIRLSIANQLKSRIEKEQSKQDCEAFEVVNDTSISEQIELFPEKE